MGFSSNTKARAWMVTSQIKNFENMGLTEEQYKNPEYIASVLTNLWCESGKDRVCAIAVCISANGLYHTHMACYGNTTTLKKVSDILYQSHVEPQLGGKKELSGYLLKEGKYAEKGERVLYTLGIENIQDNQGSRSDLEDIEEMLLKNMTPQQILSQSFRYYKYQNMILNAYADLRISNAPVRTNVYAEYHVGESGTGKSYTYNMLCEQYGIDNIYLLTDYDNNASGGMDAYMRVGAPKILFMDEFKGFGISYQKLLSMLSGYSRMQTHARYTNAFNLWSMIHITSIYPLEELYEIMVAKEYRKSDSYEQLKRRISKIIYHYIEDGEYKTYELDAKKYTSYEELKAMASHNDGFKKMTPEEIENLPFEED